MVRETISLGPDTTDGFQASAIRVFDIDESMYYHNAIEYDLSGVESIRMDNPEAVGFEADNLIHIDFVNGKSIHFMGVITEAEPTEGN
jgi:hypothetical protein